MGDTKPARLGRKPWRDILSFCNVIGVRKEPDLLEILHFNCRKLPAVSLPPRWKMFLSHTYATFGLVNGASDGQGPKCP